MQIEHEIKRARTVNEALAAAAHEFGKYFGAQGFAEAASGADRVMTLHHLRVCFRVEGGHRVRVSFDNFWKPREDLPIELLVTDQEKVFWMNTANNKEYLSFAKALAEGVEGYR